MNLVTLLYLVASRLLHPGAEGPVAPDHVASAATLFGMIGMAIAIVTTAALIVKLAPAGGDRRHGLGAGGPGGRRRARRDYRAKTVEMTKMPELVAFLHSMIGLAAVFIAVAAVAEPWAFGIAEPRAGAHARAATASSWPSARSSARSPSPAR